MLQQRRSQRHFEHFTTTNTTFEGANYNIAENKRTSDEVIKKAELTPRKHLQQNTAKWMTVNQTHQSSAIITYGLDHHHHENKTQLES
jgi:hypothetical protein